MPGRAAPGDRGRDRRRWPGGRPVPAFTDPDEEPGEQKDRERGRQPAAAGGQAPQHDADPHQEPARHSVCEPAEDRRRHHVGNDERRCQRAHHRQDVGIIQWTIGKKRSPDVRLQRGQDITVDVIEKVDRQQKRQGEPRFADGNRPGCDAHLRHWRPSWAGERRVKSSTSAFPHERKVFAVGISPSPATPKRVGVRVRFKGRHQGPHPDPLPEYRERGNQRAPARMPALLPSSRRRTVLIFLVSFPPALALKAERKQFHGLGAASLAGSEVITEGIPVASQPPPPMAFGTRSGVALKSQAGSAGSKMRVLRCQEQPKTR